MEGVDLVRNKTKADYFKGKYIESYLWECKYRDFTNEP